MSSLSAGRGSIRAAGQEPKEAGRGRQEGKDSAEKVGLITTMTCPSNTFPSYSPTYPTVTQRRQSTFQLSSQKSAPSLQPANHHPDDIRPNKENPN